MDPFTHAISGAVANRAQGPVQPAQARFSLAERSWLGGALALFPDIDYVLVLLADPLTYLNLHRGITHSVIMRSKTGSIRYMTAVHDLARLRAISALTVD
jgi:inner membrane protein